MIEPICQDVPDLFLTHTYVFADCEYLEINVGGVFSPQPPPFGFAPMLPNSIGRW